MSLVTLANMDHNELTLMIVAIAVGGSVALIGIVSGVLHSIHRTRQTELSRREIAAYVAEGSITPEDGERLLKAGREPPKPWWADCNNKKTP